MADPEHNVARIVSTVAPPPALDLRLEVGSGLAGERGVGRPFPFAGRAMAGRAGHDPPLRIAVQEQSRQGYRWSCGRPYRHGRIEAGYLKALTGAQLFRNPAHFRMPATSVGESLELPLEVACVQRCEAGRTAAIALPTQSVAREAGAGGTRASTAQSNEFTRLRQLIARPRFQLRAAGKKWSRSEREQPKGRGHCRKGTGAAAPRFPLSMSVLPTLLLCLAACKPPPEQSQSFPTANAERGKSVIQRVGCASCHTIDGIDWPKGRAAPELRGLSGRALIAGSVPNRPDVLAAFVRNAPAVAPGTTMPPMPLSEQDSQDVAAYLYETRS